MIGNIDWPPNAPRRFVSISWTSGILSRNTEETDTGDILEAAWLDTRIQLLLKRWERRTRPEYWNRDASANCPPIYLPRYISTNTASWPRWNGKNLSVLVHCW